jgi:hypothetical protein
MSQAFLAVTGSILPILLLLVIGRVAMAAVISLVRHRNRYREHRIIFAEYLRSVLLCVLSVLMFLAVLVTLLGFDNGPIAMLALVILVGGWIAVLIARRWMQ